MTFEPDLDLPCKTNWLAFDACLDLERSGPDSRRRLRAEQEARTICGGCDFRARCLREYIDEPGIIAGLSIHQRARLKTKGLVA